jgi:CheY-like chemotaxis protein
MTNKKPKAKYATVMLVDDSEIDNFINHKMIEGCNFADQVYMHTSSRSALEFLKNIERMETIPESIIPEIIFLDINMPIMDGFQFVEEFEKLTRKLTGVSKIVILTTSINPSDFELSKKYKNVIKFINKPLTHNVLNTI